MKTNKYLASMAFALCAAATPWAHAQVHEGDIELHVADNRITVGGNHAWHFSGAALFEADFGDFAGGPYLTDDPGYDSEPGTFAVGTILNYVALGSLQFWNGTQWSTSIPTQEYVRLDGNLGEDTRWGAAGITGHVTGLVGQAGSDGKLHEHLDLRVARAGAGVPAVGAYLIQMHLTGVGYQDSAPYYLAFNRGLTEENFELAVEALAPIPEPQTWALMAAGVGLVTLRLRKRRAS